MPAERQVAMADPTGAELAEQVLQACKTRGLTLGTCETDTGGLIGSLITDVAGCSAVFIGGITPYHNPPKLALARVARDLLKAHGSVSEEAALALARGARSALGVDIAVSETGITGPAGGNAERPIGLVWIAVVGPGDREVAERRVWESDRVGNKALTAQRSLAMVLEAVEVFGS